MKTLRSALPMFLTRRDFLRTATATAAAAAAAMLSPVGRQTFAAAAAAEEASRLNLVMLSGSAEYHSDESLVALAEDWQSRFRGRIHCSQLNAKDGAGEVIPHIDALNTADLVFIFTRRLRPPKEQLEVFQKYCQSGKPIIGVRTASHALEDWLIFDKEVLGGNYQGHHKPGPITQVVIAERAKSHPILKGIEPFTSPSSLYKNDPIAESSQVLLTGTIPGEKTEPIAWTHTHRDGRVFYTSLGSPDDFKNEMFRKLLDNALAWVTQRDFTRGEK
jgi:type 1 glutamine amidotransferase